MHLRLFGSRLSVRLMRSSWAFKIVITCIAYLLVVVFWWFGLQRNLNILKKNTVLQVSELLKQKEILDEAFLQYQDLNKKNTSNDFYSEPAMESINYCAAIVDQSRLANLNLQSYTTKKLKNGRKQMLFSFSGDYLELLTFLHNLHQANLDTTCSKLRVATSGYRLQIGYVCGIHTSVK